MEYDKNTQLGKKEKVKEIIFKSPKRTGKTLAMEKEKSELQKKPICPDCSGKVINYRKRTDDFWCRRCGKIFKKEDMA